MDLNLRQNDAHPYNIVSTLYDKRRSMAYANVPKIYYTHGTTFLAQFQIGTNTVSSQYHRFRRIINDRDNFVLECAIMLTKLVTVCKIPVAPLIHNEAQVDAHALSLPPRDQHNTTHHPLRQLSEHHHALQRRRQAEQPR